MAEPNDNIINNALITPEYLIDLVEQVFSEEGNGFAKIFDKYKYRDNQVSLSRTIAEGLAINKTVIIEAGTGTGKSFGELVPAILYCILTGKRLVVVTHNIALQQQLAYKDIPIVQKVLARFDITFTSALLKGKNNFLCPRRFMQTYKKIDQLSPEMQEEMKKFINVATRGDSIIIGDKEKLPYKPDDEFWELVGGSQEGSCDGCSYKNGGCFYNHLKQSAKNVDVIISNHFMLMADLVARKKNGYAPGSGLLPDFDVVVIDEAHHIEEVASGFLGYEINPGQVYRLINKLEKTIDKLGIGFYRKEEYKERLLLNLYNFRDSYTNSMNEVKAELERRKTSADFWDTPLNIDFESLYKLAEGIMWLAVRMSDYKEGGKIKGLSNSFKELYDNLSMFSKSLNEMENVYWVMYIKKRDELILKMTPVEVSHDLREGLFDRVQVAMTSATIKFDQDISMFAKKVGELEKGTDYISMFVDPPFDYERNVMFYIPKYAMDGNEDGYDDYCINEMLDLVQMSKGRAFLLFTSYSTMNMYYEKMQPIIENEWGFPCLRQGDYDRNQLIEMFKDAGNAVLFGADTFWEGIDIPGRELSLVVIQKLPFSVPDPVTKAREPIISARGGNSFLENNVFPAVTKYKQGFGRLIRHEDDKGVFCLLDGRVLSKKERYGKYFLSSMPITQKTMRQEDLLPFFD